MTVSLTALCCAETARATYKENHYKSAPAMVVPDEATTFIAADQSELDLTNSHLSSLEDVPLPASLRVRHCLCRVLLSAHHDQAHHLCDAVVS